MEDFIDKLISKALALQTQKNGWRASLKNTIEREDWHGASDCACELRDLDTEIKQIEEFIEMLRK